MSIQISVIICSHNPREDYLQRVLDALDRQSLAKEHWELLLIDNASAKPLNSKYDLNWHPNSRHVLEEELGLTPARLRGIREACAELLVFIDDDNVLPVEYLQTALKISQEYPFLGAWGGGCEPEFEVPPPGWIEPYLGNLAILNINRPSWTNQYFDYRCTPIGAGMCIRKYPAQKYLETVKMRNSSEHLDRRGGELVSCGDHDMAYCALDLGLGVGLFPELKPKHLIPSSRLEKSYILRLSEADAYSAYKLRRIRNFEVEHIPIENKITPLMRVRQSFRAFLSSVKGLFYTKESPKNFEELVFEARVRGLKRAFSELGR